MESEVKGIMCNWLVCMAVWLCTMAKDEKLQLLTRLQWLVQLQTTNPRVIEQLHQISITPRFFPRSDMFRT